MDMQVRGWREERTVWTHDTMGRAVPVTTGVTRDRDGRLVTAIAIGDGPSALVPFGIDDLSCELQQNIADTLAALHEMRQAGQ